MLNITTATTHGGNFHADDVFSAAFLQILNPDIIINRVFKVDDTDVDGVITFDIGSGKYDHHQPDAEIRPNGVKYAAFGLLWRDFGALAVPSQYVEQFDIDFIQPLDAADNGASLTPLYSTIGAFNPNWDEEQNFDAAFKNAVDFAKTMLNRLFAQYWASDYAVQVVNDDIFSSINHNYPAIVLSTFAPWQYSVFADSLCDNFNYIIFPAVRGGYNIQAIPTTQNGRDQRKPFPADWVTNKPDLATFVHPGRFLVAAKTLDDALTLAEQAQSYKEM